MKKLLFLAVVLSLAVFSACNGEENAEDVDYEDTTIVVTPEETTIIEEEVIVPADTNTMIEEPAQ